MAKGAATEKALASLHAKIAQVIEEQLGETLVVNQEAVEAGEEPQYMYTASPALLTVATRFLKDNNITADLGAEEDRTRAVQERVDALRANRGKVVTLRDLHPVAADG